MQNFALKIVQHVNFWCAYVAHGFYVSLVSDVAAVSGVAVSLIIAALVFCVVATVAITAIATCKQRQLELLRCACM